MRRLLGKPLLCRLGRHKWRRIAITVHVRGRPCEVGTKWCVRCDPRSPERVIRELELLAAPQAEVMVGLLDMGLRGIAQLEREERVRQVGEE